MAVTVGIDFITPLPVTEGSTPIQVCISLLAGSPGSRVFSVTYSTVDGMGANAALGITNC